MDSIIITPELKKDFKLLLNLAKRMDCKICIITDEEKEDMGLLKAMMEGRNG